MPSEIPGFRAECGIPDELSPIGAVVVAHRSPDEPPVNRGRFTVGRRPADEVNHRGQWARPWAARRARWQRVRP